VGIIIIDKNTKGKSMLPRSPKNDSSLNTVMPPNLLDELQTQSDAKPVVEAAGKKEIANIPELIEKLESLSPKSEPAVVTNLPNICLSTRFQEIEDKYELLAEPKNEPKPKSRRQLKRERYGSHNFKNQPEYSHQDESSWYESPLVIGAGVAAATGLAAFGLFRYLTADSNTPAPAAAPSVSGANKY